MATPQSLTTTQQQTLAAIESVKGRIEAYLPSCPVGSAAPVMSQWINGLDQYVWEFQQVAPMASWLSRQGLPQAEQRLTTLLNDLRSARTVYLQMYQGMLQTQQSFAAIWNDANTFATANILAATNYSNAVFQRWQQGYFDVTEQNCYDCHRYVGVPGGCYCYDCARRRGLVW
ncbi:MAG TPA: hypothetical protein VKQ36_07235 [Ktedonobacterales bacterium]|nr:hypothetical protein [Ktedonobacterales bacterium]